MSPMTLACSEIGFASTGSSTSSLDYSVSESGAVIAGFGSSALDSTSFFSGASCCSSSAG